MLAALGEPNVVLADGRVLAYTWTTGSNVRVVPLICMSETDRDAGAIESKERTHYLLLEFDQDGTLTRRREHHGGHINVYATGVRDAIR